MLSLFFNFLLWYLSHRWQLFVFLLIIVIFLFFCLIFCIIFNIHESLYWQRKIKKILNNQEKILEKMLPLIDLGKISLFSINSSKNQLTILRLIIDKLRDPDVFRDPKKVKDSLGQIDTIILKIILNANLSRWQMCREEDKRLFNLNEEIKSLLMIYQGVSTKHKIEIKFIADREYRLYADYCHLFRAINILLLNAVEALSNSDADKKTLNISLEKSKYLLKIYVEDNASGIATKLFTNLFDLNCFNKNIEKGLGLGLYFANEIMKKYFLKKIKIESHKNKGTKASLIIKNRFVLAEPKLKNKEIFILGAK